MPYQMTQDQIAAMLGLGQPPPAPPGVPGGFETAPGGAVSGVPVPLGPAQRAPNGMNITPVSTPAAAPQSQAGPQSPLDALREQMKTVEQLSGPNPVAPYIQHMLTPGSPTAGLASLGGVGRPGMVGDQTPGGVATDPNAALAAHLFGQQLQDRSGNQQMLMNRLGQMGNQSLAGGQLSLDAMRALGIPGGPQGSIQNAADTARAVDNPERARGAATITQAIAAHRQANPSATLDQTHNAVAASLGMSVNQMLRTLGVPVNQPTLPTAGSGGRTPGAPTTATPPVPADPRERVATEGRGLTPWAAIEQQLNAARLNPPPAGAPPGTQGSPRQIGEFLLNLNNAQPGLVQQNLPAVEAYMRDRWGGSATDSAFRASQDPRQIDRNNLLSRLTIPFQIGRQVIGGANENEQGLSMLGNLLRDRAGQ